jgi:Sec-independent protein translocase protein TatA
VVDFFNPKHLGGRGRGRGRWISEFKASLVYRVSSRTARAMQKNPVSKNKNNKQTNKQKPIKQNRSTLPVVLLSV